MIEKIINILALLIFVLEIRTGFNYLKEKWFTFIDLNENYLNRFLAFIILIFCLFFIAFLLFVSFTAVVKWISDF